MNKQSLFRKAVLLLCGAALVLASCQKENKPAADENGAATVKYAVDVTPDDNRDWGTSTDWLGPSGRLSMLGKVQLPDKSPELFRTGGQVSVPTGILVEEESYLYVTFVGEAANFNNVLGYYYYDPRQIAEFNEEVFLNQLFLSGEDGNVYFRNIIYTQTKKLAHGYTFQLGIEGDGGSVAPFPANTIVGFCLFPHSGSGEDTEPVNEFSELPKIKMQGGKPVYITTDWQFNEGETLSHTVGQTPCGDYVFAFEDLNSSYSRSSDDDFNDLVFVVGDNLQNRHTANLAPYGPNAAPFAIAARAVDEDECGQAVVDELKVTPAELTLKAGEESTVEITGGRAPYDFTISDPYYASASLDGLRLTVQGLAVGSATITVTDVDGQTAELALTINLPINIQTALIPAGTFYMGSPNEETGRDVDETRHQVTLTQSFRMGKYEVTNAQFAAFLNARNIGGNGRDANGQYPGATLIYAYSWGLKYESGQWQPNSGYANHPVVHVTWHGAAEFCRWAGGRLPTEAEWEYACRAGTTTAYSFGADAAGLGNYAWYNGNSGGTTHVTGTRQPNAWGLYDMHGNVWEWCSDLYGGNYYSSSPAADPAGPATGTGRVMRGGSWRGSARGCRSAYRYATNGYGNDGIGFRVVFVP